MKITGKGIFRKYNRIQNSSRWIQRKIGAIVDPKQKRHAHVGSPELYKRSRDFQIKFLKDMGLIPGDYLLDIGCGTLVGGVPIIHYLEKRHYYGIEKRPDVLEEARKELLASKLTHKTPVLLSEDIASLNLEREFNFVWASSVLIHFKDEILEDCFAFVSSHLSKQGKFYANVNIGNKKDDSWKGLLLLALRDAMQGDFAIGWGKSRGFGSFQIELIFDDKRYTQWDDVYTLLQKHLDTQACLDSLHDKLAILANNDTTHKETI